MRLPALALFALAACSSVPDEINPVSWYDSIAGDDEVTQAEPAPGTQEDFPNLASVPDQPPEQATDDYTQVAEGLQADKANAQYTNESLRRADDETEGTTPVVAATSETTQEAQPEPEPEPVAQVEPEPEPVVVPEPTATTTTTAATTTAAAASVPAQSAQPAQAENYEQYATVAAGLKAIHSTGSQQAAASTTATTTTVAPAAATTAAATTAATTTTTTAATAQVQAVEQTVQPVPAQPLEPAQQTTVAVPAVPAQPLPGTTVVSSTTQVAVPAATTTTVAAAATTQAAAPAASQGSFMDMFNAAYQASAARTLQGSQQQTGAVVPAVAQPTAAAALPASYASTARYRGGRPTRLIASVMFADGSARLDAQARKTLLDVAYAYGATGGPILIVGHASGSDGSNAELANFQVSQKRAVAVANELMRLQVTPENILIEAVGDNVPQVSLDMAGGAVNRRVDIFLGN